MFHNPIRRLSAAFAVTALALSASAFAFTPPPFPRLAGVNYGSPQNYNDPGYQNQLSKLSIVLLADRPGFAPGGESMESIIKSIKAKNPNELVFFYVESDYQNPSVGGPWATLEAKLNAMKWWLYPNTSFNSPVKSIDGSSWYTINNTPFTPKDSNGDDSIDWITKYFVQTLYDPAPDVDGFFMDNVFTRPNVAGDWARNGQNLAAASAQAGQALQEGYNRFFTLARQLLPANKYVLGNAASWAKYGSVPSLYDHVADGGLMEAMIGKSYSIEGWAGWNVMMQRYAEVMSAFRSPQLGIFGQYGSPTDYQSFRYGFASCLMNNGYYSFTSTSAGYSGVVWFDEYNANLGAATSSPPSSAWQKGVWRRDFANGIALVNPKGNGPQTVQLGGTFVKLKGGQDPSVNNGQKVTQVTLQDRDGIILLRQSPQQQPKAPTGVSVGAG